LVADPLDLLIVTLAVAFFITAVERFIDLSWLRGIVAWAGAAAAVFVLDYRGWGALLTSMATAFLALLFVLVGERLATPPPMVLDKRRT
jgi:hypothetical protein